MFFLVHIESKKSWKLFVKPQVKDPDVPNEKYLQMQNPITYSPSIQIEIQNSQPESSQYFK